MSTSASANHKLTKQGSQQGIEIHDWLISATTRSISDAAEEEKIQKTIEMPVPEMLFGSNSLVLRHKPSGWTYRFDALNALKCVKRGPMEEGDGGVKVSYAESWLKSRTEPDSNIPLPQTTPTTQYDWTYTTTYTGHVDPPDSEHSTRTEVSNADPNDASQTLPMKELERRDIPILFFSDVPLYEDELHDNGMARLNVRVRVMPTFFFILLRFTLRVDNVLFRVHDVRIYQPLGEGMKPSFIREVNGWEAPFESIKKFLPDKLDHTPLTDPNFIFSSISRLPKELTQGEGASTGWRALRNSTVLVRYLHEPSSDSVLPSILLSALPTPVEVPQSSQ